MAARGVCRWDARSRCCCVEPRLRELAGDDGDAHGRVSRGGDVVGAGWQTADLEVAGGARMGLVDERWRGDVRCADDRARVLGGWRHDDTRELAGRSER